MRKLNEIINKQKCVFPLRTNIKHLNYNHTYVHLYNMPVRTYYEYICKNAEIILLIKTYLKIYYY